MHLQCWLGNDALKWAAMGGHADVVNYLLSIGASVYCENDIGQSVVDIAAKLGHTNVVEILLNHIAVLQRD